MNEEKDQQKQNDQASKEQQNSETLHIKNPFKPGEEIEITQEELEKEQEYKEALTERD